MKAGRVFIPFMASRQGESNNFFSKISTLFSLLCQHFVHLTESKTGKSVTFALLSIPLFSIFPCLRPEKTLCQDLCGKHGRKKFVKSWYGSGRPSKCERANSKSNINAWPTKAFLASAKATKIRLRPTLLRNSASFSFCSLASRSNFSVSVGQPTSFGGSALQNQAWHAFSQVFV